jgi:hypothetical protein
MMARGDVVDRVPPVDATVSSICECGSEEVISRMWTE